MPQRRKKVWIDRFQTLLFLRIAFYFLFYQVAVWAVVLIEARLSAVLGGAIGTEGAAYCFPLLALVVAAIGVLFIYDAVRYAHRIVGPIHRLREAIKAVTTGEGQEPMSLRKDDFLQDVKAEFNEMLRALEQRGASVLKKAEPEAARAPANGQAVSV